MVSAPPDPFGFADVALSASPAHRVLREVERIRLAQNLPFDRRGHALRRDSGQPGTGRHERGQLGGFGAEDDQAVGTLWPADQRVADRLRSTTQSLESALYDLLAEAQMRGQITSARSATDLAGFLVTSLRGLRVMGAINPDRAALTRYAEVALTCLD
ncbi:hypothetical protein OHA01_15335 [Micromonospora zamorensis]|uniref:hypothetical protein n=1 Tax=Micromonospora zamorensis TaxID=709883 RepID=UPI00386B35FF|nr:hypothetical protein OHA01_15335 [Micromonospora zamorensis]